MELKNVVPWGRNLDEYQNMFQLSQNDITSKKILGCGDGPSSFNYEATILGGNIASIDPIYQFKKDEIQARIEETSLTIIEQITQNQDDFVWKNIKSIDELIDTRLNAMNTFIKDYNKGKDEHRYIYQELPKLSFDDNSFDMVISSHFLFLYSEYFDLNFHIDSILEMCRVSKNEVKIFPIYNLQNQESKHLKPLLEILKNKGYKTEIIKTKYEFQKGADEMLHIKLK
jgi:hypothetical protein